MPDKNCVVSQRMRVTKRLEGSTNTKQRILSVGDAETSSMEVPGLRLVGTLPCSFQQEAFFEPSRAHTVVGDNANDEKLPSLPSLSFWKQQMEPSLQY